MEKKLKVTLTRSTIRRPSDQKLTVKALGFRRLHQTRVFPDNPAVRGMINKVSHLVVWEEIQA